jgi:uncharacterized protein YxeA
MKKLLLWVVLIFVMVDGIIISILFMIKIIYGTEQIIITKDNEVLPSRENFGKVI